MCDRCRKFLVFVDSWGNYPENVPCYCQESSKLQIAGRHTAVPGALYYVCRLGMCNFYLDADQEQARGLKKKYESSIPGYTAQDNLSVFWRVNGVDV